MTRVNGISAGGLSKLLGGFQRVLVIGERERERDKRKRIKKTEFFIIEERN